MKGGNARSEGARALGAIVARGTISAVASKLDVDEAAVRHWLAGRRTPDKDRRVRIAEAYGVSADAWTVLPAPPSVRPPPTSDQVASHEPGAGAPRTAVQRAVPAGRGLPEDRRITSRPSLAAPGMTHRARLSAIVERLEGEIEACGLDVPRNHVAALYGQLQAAAGRLAHLDGEDLLTVSQILRSRAWREIERVLVDVLRKHPGAAEDFARASASLTTGEAPQ